jgi:hypothetical protein
MVRFQNLDTGRQRRSDILFVNFVRWGAHNVTPTQVATRYTPASRMAFFITLTRFNAHSPLREIPVKYSRIEEEYRYFNAPTRGVEEKVIHPDTL